MYATKKSQGSPIVERERRELKDDQSPLPLFPKSCPYSMANVQTNSPKTEFTSQD